MVRGVAGPGLLGGDVVSKATKESDSSASMSPMPCYTETSFRAVGSLGMKVLRDGGVGDSGARSLGV